MNGSVYLYFGHIVLSAGSFENMQKPGITPHEGMALAFNDFDPDDQDEVLPGRLEGTELG